jgi:hypothetical protein
MTRLLSLFAGAAVATLLAGPAMAQGVTGASNGTTSGATSSSMTNVYPTTVPTTANGQVATDPSGYSPYNTHSTIDNHGIPNQAPALSLPSVYGLNPCSVGASVGITTPMVGIGGALSSADPACEARNNAALAITAFHNELLAREVLCTRDEWRKAWARIGKPCLDDQRAAQPPAAKAAAAAPVANAAPAAPPAQPAAPAVAQMGVMMVPQVVAPAALVMTSTPVPQPATPAVKHTVPDWCGTVSPSEWKASAAIRRQCS